MRKKRKSKGSENYKKKPPTDKPKSTPCEQKELSKKARDKHVSVKDSSTRRDRESLLILKLLDRLSSSKSRRVWLNRRGLREKTIWTRFKSKNKSKPKKRKSKKATKLLDLRTCRMLENKSPIRRLELNKIDLITLKTAEKLEKIFKMRETRSRVSRMPSLMNLKLTELTANTCMSYKRRRCHSEQIIHIRITKNR